MYRMLVLASVLSHNNKCVAQELFLSIVHKKLVDFISKQQERTSGGLLIGGRGKIHNVLLFKSCFLSPDFIPLERCRAFCTVLNVYVYLHLSK